MIVTKQPTHKKMASITGYECNFVSEPDDTLKCLICLAVARDPWQHGECGRLFCEKCLNKYGKEKPCSNCRTEQPTYFKDNKSQREIKALRVKCDNVERGCERKGTVGRLEEHVAICDFTPVPCPKECKEGSSIRMIIRKKLDAHLKEECVNRDYECKHCGKKDTYANITDIHDNVCEKKKIPCTNAKCTEIIESGKMDEHLKNDCEYTQMSCKYESIGCDKLVKRKDLKTHEQDDSHHLQQALEAIALMKEERDTVKKGGSFVFKLTHFKTKKANSEAFYSQPFYTSPGGYRLQIEIHPNGDQGGKDTHMSVYVTILKGKYNGELNWPFAKTVTCTLLNQLADEKHHILNLINSATATNSNLKSSLLGDGKGVGKDKFISHKELLENTAADTQYLKEDTLYFKVTVEETSHKPWLECTAK